MKVRVLNENAVSSKLPAGIDSFLQDVAQMYGPINYTDIMNFGSVASRDDIKRMNYFKRKFKDAAKYDDEAIMKNVANTVSEYIKKVIGSERLTEETNFDKLVRIFPELADEGVVESFDEQGNHEKCEKCGTLLNDMGTCPRCDDGEEDLNEALTLNEDTLLEFELPWKKTAAEKAAAKRKKAEKKDDKAELKILARDLSPEGKSWIFMIKQGDKYKKFNQNQWIGLFEGETDPKKLSVMANAIVLEPNGKYVRRGLEDFLGRNFLFAEGENDTIKNGFTGKYMRDLERTGITLDDDISSDSDLSDTDEADSIDDASDSDDGSDSSDDTRVAYDITKGFSDKHVGRFRLIAKALGVKLYDAFDNPVELTSSVLKNLTKDTVMDYKIEVSGKKYELVDWLTRAVRNKVITEDVDYGKALITAVECLADKTDKHKLAEWLSKSLRNRINESILTEKNWELRIDQQVAFRLRDALESDITDYEELKSAIADVYRNINNILPNELFDKNDLEDELDNLEYIVTPDDETDEEEVEDEWNYQLSRLYDLCDAFNIWIPIRGLDEGLTDANAYKIVYYKNTACRDRRPETADDVENDWIEAPIRADSDLGALQRAIAIIRNRDIEDVIDDGFDSEASCISYLEEADWGDGSPIIIRVEGPDGNLYNTGYNKDSWIEEFCEAEDYDTYDEEEVTTVVDEHFPFAWQELKHSHNLEDYVEYFVDLYFESPENEIYDMELLRDTIKDYLTAYIEDEEDLDESKSLTEAPVIKLDDSDIMNPSKVDFKDKIAKATAEEEAEKARQAEEARKEQFRVKYKDVPAKLEASLGKGANAEETLEVLFGDLVPPQGNADTVAGEMVRAMMRVLYRDANDGDKFFMGYGLETCASSVAYLCSMIPVIDKHVDLILEEAFRYADNDEAYTKQLNQMTEEVVDHIMNNQELIFTPNEEDSREYNYDYITEKQPRYEFECDGSDDVCDLVNEGILSAWDLYHYVEDQLQWDNAYEGAEVEIPWAHDSTSITVSNLTKYGYEQLEDSFQRNRDGWWEDLVSDHKDELDRINNDEDDDNDDIEESLSETDLKAYKSFSASNPIRTLNDIHRYGYDDDISIHEDVEEFETRDHSNDFTTYEDVLAGMQDNASNEVIDATIRTFNKIGSTYKIDPKDVVIFVDSEWEYDPVYFADSSVSINRNLSKFNVADIEIIKEMINHNIWLYFKNQEDANSYLAFVDNGKY